MEIKGRTAFITGSARGIGKALAIAMAERGCDIIGCDLRADTQSDTAAAVHAAGQVYTALDADLSEVEQAVAVTEEAIALGFDMLINNAGIATSGEFDAVPFERWQKTIAVNLTGLMAITHTALPYLRTRDEAFIVNMSSVAGVIGAPGMETYCATKFGVNGFTRCLEYDLEDTNVHVASIHPTMVKTRMIDGVGSGPTAEIEVDDVVKAILRTIEANTSQTFVPGSVRFPYDIASRLFPGIVRKMMRKSEMQSWRVANKDVPDA
jgi:short-subunit dehydrogenase